MQDDHMTLRECVTAVFVAIIAAAAFITAVVVVTDAYRDVNADTSWNPSSIEFIPIHEQVRYIEVPRTVYVDRPVYIPQQAPVPPPYQIPASAPVPRKGGGFVAGDGHILQWNEKLTLNDLQVGMPVCRLNRDFGAIPSDSGTVQSRPYTSAAGEWKFDVQNTDGTFRSVYATDGGLTPYGSGTYNRANITVYGDCATVVWPGMK